MCFSFENDYSLKFDQSDRASPVPIIWNMVFSHGVLVLRKTPGQKMLYKTTDEFRSIKGQNLLLVGLAITSVEDLKSSQKYIVSGKV